MGILYGLPMRAGLPEVTQAVFLAWRGALEWIRWDKKITLSTPLWVGAWLTHTAKLQGFSKWDKIGISLAGDVVGTEGVKSFAELQEEYGLHHTQFFNYLQLRHALVASHLEKAGMSEFNPLEAKLLQGALGRGGLSRIYKSLIINSPECFQPLRNKWEEQVGTLDEEDWRDARAAPREIAISSRLRFIQLKFLHMAYKTPTMLHRMIPGYSPNCPKCAHTGADFLHMTWSCPSLQDFWNGITRIISRVLDREIELTPRSALLGILFDLGGRRGERAFIGMATMIAKRDIARNWMSREAPKLSVWKAGVDWVSKLEEPIYAARGCPGKHEKIWGKWWSYYGLNV